ncbi:MAG TPA: peptidoglycan-binding protein, partial [Micromonosporaceae bacterium]|nr:peptidoglycan-binding protein [Micromonosporaceae bacterium]
ASLLVALALAAVLRLRRRARQHHIDGHRPVPPEAAAIEAELRVAQEPLDVERLEQALRSLASGLAGRDGELPDPFGAVVDHGNVWLMLTEACPDPPQPWLEHGKSWLLPVDAQVPDASGEIAPLPTLAAVGWQEATHLLLDLERVGYVNVRGDSAARGNLLRYLASELALNSWSDDIELTLAGFPIHEAELLIALNPDRVRAASSITEAATRIAKRIETARATLAHTGVSDALAGRVSDTAADAWMPQVLIVSDPDDAGMAALADLSTALDRAGRCGISVVVGAPSDAPTYDRWTLTVNADGSLGLPFPVPGPPVNTAGLPVSELERLAQLMQTARSSAEIAVPPAAEPERWADGTDAGGGLLEPPPPTGPIEETTAMPDAGHDASNDSDKDQQRVVVTAAIPAEGPRRVITAAIRQRRRQTDPHLDDDLAAWRQRDPSRPRIGILGPVTVEAPGIQPEQRQRFHAEIIVYLAQRGARGADRDQLDAALWPDRVVKDASRRVAITRARRWLGETPDGEQWLPEMGADRVYRLREGYLVDWHLFRRLRARGEAHGSAGVKDLRAALELVRGVPLDGADRPYAAGGRNPYTWLAESDMHPEHITAAIVDTAHRLAQLCLQADDTAGARWAAAQAWLADPSRGYDQPWRDLLLSHHRDGREAELRATFAELMRARDAEVPEDLDPETFRLVLELLPDVVRSRQLVP